MSDLFFGPPMEKLLKLVGEILVEMREMRREQQEQVRRAAAYKTLVVDSLYNTKYEG